jgi:ABC-type multidrug transport system fused ATPase/permease subunit
LFSLFAAVKIFSDLWIGYWTSDKYSLSNSRYILVYLALVILLFMILLFRSVFFGIGVSNAGINIFLKVFVNLIKRPMSFFDTTPVGQILVRFVNDQNDTDMRIPKLMNTFLSIMFTFLGTFILLCVVSPFHLIIIIAFFILIFAYLKKYVLTTTELKRMNKISESPIISTLSELMNGNVLIR